MGGRLVSAIEIFLAAAFLVCLGFLLFRSFQAPLSTDEGYNLEVVDNLAKKGRYASYGNRRFDAPWSVRSLPLESFQKRESPPDWPFDPRVTTGPSVLVPLAVIWGFLPENVAGLRLVMWGFFFAALIALWALGKDFGAGIAGFVAASAIFATLFFGFQPSALLGEVPATAFFLWGVLAASRSHLFIAGLLWGLAILAKTIFLPAAALAVLLAILLAREPSLTRRVLLPVIGVSIPLVLFELYRLLSLGSLDAWWTSWQEMRAFAAEQSGWRFLGLVPKKLRSLADTGPGSWVGLAAAFALLTSFVSPQAGERQKVEAHLRLIRLTLTAAGVVLGATWLLFSAQTSYRQGLPAFLLLYGGIMLPLPWKGGLSWPAGKAPLRHRITALSLWIVCLCVLAALGTWAWKFATFGGWREGFRAQREAARALAASGAKAISPLVRWFEPFPVLSGLRMAPCPGPEQAVVVTLWAEAVLRQPRSSFRSLCATPIAENRDALICFPKDSFAVRKPYELTIKDWGPRETKVGVVPNPQPTGDGAFWFILEQPLPFKPYMILLLDGKPVGPLTWSPNGDWFSSAVSRKFVRRPGALHVTVFDACQSDVVPIGVFRVLPR